MRANSASLAWAKAGSEREPRGVSSSATPPGQCSVCSRGSTCPVYPLGVLEDAPTGDGALPGILPGGIIDAYRASDPGGTRPTRRLGEGQLAPQDEANRTRLDGAAVTTADQLEAGTEASDLDPTFRHSYSRDQAILIRRLRRSRARFGA